MVALTFERRIGERHPTPPVTLEWLPKPGPVAVAVADDGDQPLVGVVVDDGDRPLVGVVVDVSVTGAAIELRDASVEPGDRAFMTVEGESTEVVVRRTEPPTPEGTTRVGVEFVHLESDAERRLFGYVGRGRMDEAVWLSRARYR